MKTKMMQKMKQLLTLSFLLLFAKAIAAPPSPPNPAPVKMENATFAMGCFWAAQAEFAELRGVSKVVAGYSGGKVANPTYDMVAGKKTGHAEAVDIEFDPNVISYRELVNVFFTIHDPTTIDRQGNDEGPEYRSMLFYRNDTQKHVAEDVRKVHSAKHRAPIVTEIVPFKQFWPAESYHQFYFAAHPNESYCKYVVADEVARFRSEFREKLKSH